MNGNTAIKQEALCEHCGHILKTKKEKEQGYCEDCYDRYNEEMYAIYGDDLYK